MSEYHTKEEYLTAVKYAKLKGLKEEDVKAAVKHAMGLFVQVGPRKIPVIVSTGYKSGTPRINPTSAAQAKFLEILKKIQEAKK